MKNILAAVIGAILFNSTAFAGQAGLVRRNLVNQKAYLANSFSQILYVFDLDPVGAKPVCTKDCAEKWPPFIVTADEAKTLPANFTVIARENGLLQVTLQGRALYTFFLDRTPAELKGDGVGGVWHAVQLGGQR